MERTVKFLNLRNYAVQGDIHDQEWLACAFDYPSLNRTGATLWQVRGVYHFWLCYMAMQVAY